MFILLKKRSEKRSKKYLSQIPMQVCWKWHLSAKTSNCFLRLFYFWTVNNSAHLLLLFGMWNWFILYNISRSKIYILSIDMKTTVIAYIYISIYKKSASILLSLSIFLSISYLIIYSGHTNKTWNKMIF